MKPFLKCLRSAISVSLVMMAVCGLAYPALVTGMGQVLFSWQANGSLLTARGERTEDPGRAAGSALVGQDFSGNPMYLRGRISEGGYDTYAKEEGGRGGSTGSANYGPTDERLTRRVERDVEEFLRSHPGVERGDIPADLLTASGSGLDPHISPEAAEIQVSAVAQASGLAEERVREIIERHTEGKVLGVFGHGRVHVLKCNLDIAKAMGEM